MLHSPFFSGSRLQHEMYQASSQGSQMGKSKCSAHLPHGLLGALFVFQDQGPAPPRESLQMW